MPGNLLIGGSPLPREATEHPRLRVRYQPRGGKSTSFLPRSADTSLLGSIVRPLRLPLNISIPYKAFCRQHENHVRFHQRHALSRSAA